MNAPAVNHRVSTRVRTWYSNAHVHDHVLIDNLGTAPSGNFGNTRTARAAPASEHQGAGSLAPGLAVTPPASLAPGLAVTTDRGSEAGGQPLRRVPMQFAIFDAVSSATITIVIVLNNLQLDDEAIDAPGCPVAQQ